MDALVLDAAQRQSLVCVRSLGGAGLAVGAFDSTPYPPAFSSRWCTVAGAIPDPAGSQDSFVDSVLERVERHRPRAIICSHDGSLEALRRRRADLEQHVPLALASQKALGVAVSKSRTLGLAAELGIPVPRAVEVTGTSDVPAAVEELGLPLVVKPETSWVEGTRGGARFTCVLVVDLDEALRAVHALELAGGSALLQEWLTGRREAVSLFRADGRIWARFAQVADRMHPPFGGSSVARESIPLPSDIADAAEQLVEASDLDGYSEIEFRRDAAGSAKLMEINPRLSASVELAVRAGVDFPLLLYRWTVGDALQLVPGYRTGLRMRWLGGDLRWLRETLRNQGRPDALPASRAIRSFLVDFVRPAQYDYLRRDDLGPAIAATTSFVRAKANRAKREREFSPSRRTT